MPQISMGRTGYWIRWVRKPSVSKIEKLGIEGLDVDESMGESQDFDIEGDTTVASPECVCDFASPFDMNVEDRELFPPLAPTDKISIAKLPVGAWTTKPENEMTLEESAFDMMLEESAERDNKDESLDPNVEDGTTEDWVIVSSDVATASASIRAKQSFDAQHPRNAVARRQTSKTGPEQGAPSIDWSVAGTPTALIRQLIRGSANAAHHGIYDEKKASVVPLHIMRAENIGSSKRQKSAPKTPRSQSKPRAMRQPSIGR
jgi:hypothetical protein